MADFGRKLVQIAGLSDHKAKSKEYTTLLNDAISRASAPDIMKFIDHMSEEKTPLVVSRPLLSDFVAKVQSLPQQMMVQMALHAISKLQPRTVAFEEHIVNLRGNLARLYEAEGRAQEAAEQLMAIPVDSSTRMVDAEAKTELFVKIATLILQTGKADVALTYITRASATVHKCPKPVLVHQYKRCFAQVLDLNQQFIKAAIHYYDISQNGPDEERRMALQQAVNSAILAEAGPQRSRMLATLYKDERTQYLDHYGILKKMYLENVLKPDEAARFSAGLPPHQVGIKSEGLTVVQHAFLEHNLLSASRLYNNISFDELGLLLGVSPELAERFAAKMIGEARMGGSIDQISRLIIFETTGSEQELWDHHIERACYLVNNILETIGRKHPDYARIF
ncbi:COP9 signalosome complex subunit 4 [Pelomyxa schiedti]|nr:COP9 signalosome complex subunit 4 [Pelomyxa schiedti]